MQMELKQKEMRSMATATTAPQVPVQEALPAPLSVGK